jgi:hypothetical protein
MRSEFRIPPQIRWNPCIIQVETNGRGDHKLLAFCHSTGSRVNWRKYMTVKSYRVLVADDRAVVRLGVRVLLEFTTTRPLTIFRNIPWR